MYVGAAHGVGRPWAGNRAPNLALPAAASQRHFPLRPDSSADAGPLEPRGASPGSHHVADGSRRAAASGVTTRRGLPDDAARISAFAARVFHESFAADNDPGDMAAYMASAFTPERQRDELADPANTWVLAESDGELVGYALIKRGEDAPECVTVKPSAELSRLYVDRRWHGAGIAQRLMNGALEDAWDRRARGLWLGVWEHNVRAVRFYAKHGFVDIGSHEFVLGSDVQTDRVMWRRIES